MNIERSFGSEKIASLSRFPEGLHGTIVDVVAEPELHGRLMGMGLFVGTRFQLLRGGGDRGTTVGSLPFLLAIGETRVAMGREIAETILVEP
ncbi:MAG: ferrous iron transport protein A [Planctomycetaceae bacterium]|jgi:Fe2+ transport system protein FeoA|nr:ferrous iron transport protein A [Planctomycetaceae bacterium]